MRCRPLRWLLGLPILALVAAIALFGEASHIQADLRDRATSALQAAGLDWAQMAFDGRDVHVSGSAESAQEQQAVLDAVKATWGVRVVGDETSLIDALSPYVWSLQRTGKAITIDGYAATVADRKAVADAAAGPLKGLSVTPRLKLARGMPPREQWLAAIGFAAQQAALLSNGEVRLDDLGLSIGGVAQTPQAYVAVEKALSSQLPAGVTLIKDAIAPPVVKPYVWSASWKGQALVLDGLVPGETQRKQLEATAAELFPGASIADHMLVAAGQPDDWSQAAQHALAGLAQLESGTLRLVDAQADLRGLATEQDTAERVAKAFRGDLPAGYRAAETITYRQARVMVAKPYAWSAQYNGDVLRLEGYVPDETTKSAIAKFAEQRFKGARITDRTVVAAGAPNDFVNAAQALLDSLGRLDQGAAKLTDATVDFSGHAADKATADASPGDLRRALPTGFSPSIEVVYGAPKLATQVTPKLPPPKVVAAPKATVSVSAHYIWDAEVESGAVVLSGTIPNAEDRNLVLSLAQSRLPGVKIVDNMSEAEGLPSSEIDWLRMIDNGLKAIADVGGGHARLTDRTLVVTGATSDKAIPDYVAETLRQSAPAGYTTDARVDYAPPPAPPAYVTTLKYDGLKVVLEGAVPSLAAKGQLMSRLKPLFPGRDFEDRSEVTAGGPDHWFDALGQGLAPLSSLDAGQLTLRGHDLFLSGTTEDEQVLAKARQRVSSGLPKGYASKDLLTYVAPPQPDPNVLAKRQDESKYNVKKLMKQSSTLSAPECQAVLNSVLRGKAFFAPGRADLDGRAAAVLSAVVVVAKRCPATHVDISGHTDSDGAATFNQQLSERRAQAVVKFLTQKGVAPARLTALGLGQSQPIAPNDTPVHKASNRRIEFAVTQTQG